MKVWAISDLHLSFARPDRRERHAARWQDHALTMERHWQDAVGRDDLVLIPGDISMARNHRELQPDLDWLGRLPGLKVLSPGNHDSWFGKVDSIRPMLRRSQRAVDGDAIQEYGIVICGARGAPVNVDPDHSEADCQATDRAIASAEAMLEAASRLREPNMPLVVLWHHPPFDQHGRPGPWVDRFEASGVTACVYGHLHAQLQWSLAVQGSIGGIRYHCVAADAIGFRPLRIDGLDTH
ncbi:metallophosphoesterase [Tautonia plasticadhaerens]|uniref:Calcineurin-like phosphoesterase n=1 Tax=Tautonia plasticadhaerens TaxID=2527974 RepID=A0A518H8Y0_9BACT|nr:metallophosphoesterase [Tautonia plasticadhaerens]QDV37303.1 Calcineurin-like phosphoesterase [Tautonia plasticadhaerens]